MTPKKQAENLVNRYRMILMDEDTDCGNEILCSLIAIKNALICVQQIINANPQSNPFNNEQIYSTINYWLQVKKEIEKL